MKRPVLIFSLVMFSAACQYGGVAPPPGAGYQSRLTGVLTESATGAPLEGTYVYAYRDSNTHFFGPPNYMSGPSGSDGSYLLELPPGKYYLFARKRGTGSYQGPLNKNDHFGEAPRRLVKIPGGSTTVDMELQQLGGMQFYRPEKFSDKTTTVVTGRIVDSQGNPVLGSFAFAYRGAFNKRMPPDYASLAADAEGRYILYLDEGGDYVVGARLKQKEPPERGEPVGFYRGDRATPLSVAAGTTVRNVDITVSPFTGSPELTPPFIPLQGN